MIWLVQNALFGDEFGYDNFIAAIDATGARRIQLDHVFWDATIDLKLTGITDPKSLIPFGTRSFVRYAIQQGWNVFWNDNFNYPDLTAYGEHFINHDMTVETLDELEVPDTGKVYIREAAGFNIIKGKVISGYAWPDWVNGFKRDRHDDTISRSSHDWHPIDGSTKFIWAPVKQIIDEYRVWIVNGQVASASQYISNGEIKYSNADENWEVTCFAKQMFDLESFGMDTLVLDVFRTPAGLKVGEINCMHCSGWYAIDSLKVVEALSKAY